MGVTLGMMARAPVPGGCKTRLAAVIGEEPAARLYAAMIRDSIENYSRIGATRNVVLAAPELDGMRVLSDLTPPGWQVISQTGRGLGERLSNALRALSSDGCPVLLMGSDSPTVPITPISTALACFDGPDRVLFGPTDDGGYYLIGMSSLDLEVFHDIPWSTSQVLETTLARCAARSLSTEILPRWYDVDEGKDLQRLRAELSDHPERAAQCADILRQLGMLRAGR